MFICEKDEHCIDCPKNCPEEICEHWIDVEPVVHGHWKPVKRYTGVECCGYKEETVESLRCSICDNEIDVSEGHFHYCPNCGARIDEVC